MSRLLVRRIRRKFMGGRVDIRIYDDASMKVRCDHPSNDPAVEFAMCGAITGIVHKAFSAEGLGLALGPMAWRDDQ